MIRVLQWLIPWEPSATVIIITFITAIFYIRGCRKKSQPIMKHFYFWLGLVLLYAVLQTQFEYYSEHEFFMHRIQHSVLHHISPFLIALSEPGVVLVIGYKLIMPRNILQFITTYFAPILQPIIQFLNHPIIAPIIFCGIILFWLIPPIHFIAMLDWRLYRVMNWGMAINGIMFWNLVLNSRNLKATTRIIMILAIIPPQIIMGMLIFAAPYELYKIYTACGRVMAISPLDDQQIGGLILWIPAAMMSVLGMLVLIKREWLKQN